jgi:hypothetical protein
VMVVMGFWGEIFGGFAGDFANLLEKCSITTKRKGRSSWKKEEIFSGEW